MIERTKILISLSKEEAERLDEIKNDLGLKFKNVTVSFLINWYLKLEDRMKKLDNL